MANRVLVTFSSSYKNPGFQVHRSGGDEIQTNFPTYRKNDEFVIENKGTQTDYRESETQTWPWEAPYKLTCRTNKQPEILSLVGSTWGNGLPAGMQEIRRIQRMRMKKKWLEILPPMDTPANIKTCETIMSAIDANEWAFREAEIELIMDSRMELMEKLKENDAKVKEEKNAQRLERFASRLGRQRDKQILDIRETFLREIRKLNRKHLASSAASYKVHRSDIIAAYANPASHLYAPNMRHGFRSKPRHEILDKTLLPETYVNKEISVDNLTDWLPTYEGLQNLDSMRKPDELYRRRTRWTDETLRMLHADLKAIRLNDAKDKKLNRPALLKRKYKLPNLPVTPLARASDDGDNYWEKNSLLLQKITRGRAIQCMMFEGRDRCRELIDELKSTHLPRDSEDTSHRSKENVTGDDAREEGKSSETNNRLCEILDSLEGMTVAGMLDMLSKEETRLREERKAHALALLVERERARREAEESGRRQLECNRRRELDEMFRQIVKVNQDTVQTYLEAVISEEIEKTADKDANRYIEKLADQMDASILEYQEQEPDATRDQELITDMVHNFLLPEVDKQIMRQQIRDGQQEYLKAAHRIIYDEMKNAQTKEKLEENSKKLINADSSLDEGEEKNTENESAADVEDIDPSSDTNN